MTLEAIRSKMKYCRRYAIFNSIRISDLLARYGVEEFVIIMHETCIEEATLVADRLRRRIINLPLLQVQVI
ncbi:diguanylate cyclase domain-containing protein [Anaplasma phagocytophilum]|uniref:diguanylate cyclase domain-containing protein n=1 Tax=Anaplasma phagocytophilum TaxID=948 RepID=UPI00041441F9|nr:diguanylate cyclase [Anaplasma phagocytophilum]KDB57257.1 hypothetical protein P030_04485 [Anaplasma phagocytophilum str. CRT35]